MKIIHSKGKQIHKVQFSKRSVFRWILIKHQSGLGPAGQLEDNIDIGIVLCLLLQQNIDPKKNVPNCQPHNYNQQQAAFECIHSRFQLQHQSGSGPTEQLVENIEIGLSCQKVAQKSNKISQNINRHDKSSTAVFECIQIKYQSRSGPTEQLLWRILMDLRFVLLLNRKENENNFKWCIPEKRLMEHSLAKP